MYKKLRRFYKYSIFFIVLIFINLPLISAENYYADITINVDDSGFVTIDGNTNHPDLLLENSQVYTSKKQSYWLLNITKDEIFSEFIFSIKLPEGSSINFVKSSGFINIEESSGSLIVKGFGENESLSIVVQYQITKTSDFDIMYILYFAIIVVAIILAYFIFKDKRKKTVKTRKNNDTEHSFRGLNERQKEIMQLLIDSENPLTQTDIQKELEIPKAAVSRNIHSLEIKGLIEIEKIGMSHLIRLKKP